MSDTKKLLDAYQKIEDYCYNECNEPFKKFITEIDYCNNYFNNTYLFYVACKYNNYKIFDYLFNNVCDLNYYIQICCKAGHSEVYKYLFKHYGTSHKCVDYHELFRLTCLSNKTENVEYVFNKVDNFDCCKFYKHDFPDIRKKCNIEMVDFILKMIPCTFDCKSIHE